MKYSNNHADQAATRSGVQRELWSTDKNWGIININSWLLRVTWNGVYTVKKPWGTKVNRGD